jgi:hypothetical protein
MRSQTGKRDGSFEDEAQGRPTLAKRGGRRSGSRLRAAAYRIGGSHGVAEQVSEGATRQVESGLKNRATPGYNEVAIVREVLVAPVFDSCEAGKCAGSPYFGEPLTLVLGILDPDGDFLEFHYDGRRFEPAEG